MYMRWNFGVSFGWGWGPRQRLWWGGGGWWNPIIFICPFHKYFTRHMLQTCVVGDNYYWLHNQPKIRPKSDVSKMFSEKWIFANFHVYFQYIHICEGALILWRHSDDIWSLMVLILVWIDRAGPGLKKTRPLFILTYLMKAWKQWNGSYVGGVDIYISNSFDYELKKKSKFPKFNFWILFYWNR